VASTQSHVGIRPVQPIESSSVACDNDDGRLLSQSPHTLTCYPAYKPSNINAVGESRRPLSYQWLVGLCAEHVHVKRDLIERYVERLDLLHVVPRNLTDTREKSLRNALVRRFFSPAAGDRSHPADDTPKAPRCRRRKLQMTRPPKKLL